MALFYNTNQGNPLLGFQGFEYRYEYSVRTRSGHSWRVAMSLVRAIKCRARVYHKNKDELPVKGEHNHTGDEVGVIISFVSPKGQIHPVWYMWDRLCGTISKFWAVQWDTWYQFSEMSGTQGTHEYRIQLDEYFKDMFFKSYEFDGIDIESI